MVFLTDIKFYVFIKLYNHSYILNLVTNKFLKTVAILEVQFIVLKDQKLQV